MKQYLIFKIDGTKYALSTSEILRLTEATKITKLPHATEGFLGVTQVDGSAYSIYDAGYLLSKKFIEFSENKKFILLQDMKVGLFVETVNEVMDIEDGSIQTVSLEDVLKQKVALINTDVIVMMSAKELIKGLDPVEENI